MKLPISGQEWIGSKIREVYVLGCKSIRVGWGTLALINAGIAQGKNRLGINWFVVSLLLGPLATLLVVVSEKKE
jgi:hypothetical protein